MVVNFWKDETFSDGRRALVGRSTNIYGAPINSESQLITAHVFGSIIESDGEGSKLTDIRFVDFGG